MAESDRMQFNFTQRYSTEIHHDLNQGSTKVKTLGRDANREGGLHGHEWKQSQTLLKVSMFFLENFQIPHRSSHTSCKLQHLPDSHWTEKRWNSEVFHRGETQKWHTSGCSTDLTLHTVTVLPLSPSHSFLVNINKHGMRGIQLLEPNNLRWEK